MEISTVIIICGTAFILGIIFAMVLDKSLLRFRFNSGYRQAAQDILRDHIYKDTGGNWHQLQMTWRYGHAISHEDPQKSKLYNGLYSNLKGGIIMENENMVTNDNKELTDEQLTAISKLLIDIMCCAAKTIDWGRTFDDFRVNHEPEDYGITMDVMDEIMEALSEDIGAEAADEMRNNGYVADLVKDFFRGVIDHAEPCMDESQQSN